MLLSNRQYIVNLKGRVFELTSYKESFEEYGLNKREITSVMIDQAYFSCYLFTCTKFCRLSGKHTNFVSVFANDGMKKVLITLGVLCILVGCNNKKNAEQSATPTETTDSLDFSMEESGDTAIVVEDSIPAAVDKSFDDFFYNFASDSVFQLKRISFPLYFFEHKKAVKLTRSAWKYDPLFSRMPVYTVIFDDAEDMMLEKDTAQQIVHVEKVNLKNKQMKQYSFHKKKGLWTLVSIQMLATKKNEEPGEDFLDFYTKFAVDSVFQSQRLYNPLAFVTPDPDDEFRILETILDEGQWFAFRPPISGDMLTNIKYGQSNDFSSRTKVIEYKGFGNGFNNVLHFEKVGGLWKLVRFEDLSD